MADAVTATKLYDGPGMAVWHFTNVSDGTGESAVLKVDVSALVAAADEVAIAKISYATSGMAVDILCDADSDTLLFTCPADHSGEHEFLCYGAPGLKNNAGTGKTGDLKFTTRGHTAGDTYAITLWLRKIDT